jgi:hypothetical protein
VGSGFVQDLALEGKRCTLWYCKAVARPGICSGLRCASGIAFAPVVMF